MKQSHGPCSHFTGTWRPRMIFAANSLCVHTALVVSATQIGAIPRSALNGWAEGFQNVFRKLWTTWETRKWENNIQNVRATKTPSKVLFLYLSKSFFILLIWLSSTLPIFVFIAGNAIINLHPNLQPQYFWYFQYCSPIP